MGFTVEYVDKDDKEARRSKSFFIRADAEELAESLRSQGHGNVNVISSATGGYKGNFVALALTVIGIAIYAIGLVGGILLSRNEANEIVWRAVWISWFWTFVAGTFFIGIAEMIKLLDKILKKLSS
ncbi:hypothetical protein ACF3MZ_06480 [Paenibacillaceae bacterium WGS1546]|uniref:hypothetical protein n=1 Tax=Cohnella sp. WGS1546 TaxID=3366810 RepID=UPI00372D3C95